jgi:hypothetical protein
MVSAGVTVGLAVGTDWPGMMEKGENGARTTSATRTGLTMRKVLIIFDRTDITRL